MNKTLRLTIILSILFHLTVLFFRLTLEQQQTPTQSTDSNPTLLSPGVQSIQAEILPVDGDLSTVNTKCSSQIYEGIGYLFQPSTGTVINVPPGYPAYDAGIRLGDVIIETQIEPDAEGYYHIRVRRHGIAAPLIFHIKVQPICYDPHTKTVK